MQKSRNKYQYGDEVVDALKTAEVYLECKLVTIISMRVAMFTDLGLYLMDSLIICMRLRASILEITDGRGVKHIPV